MTVRCLLFLLLFSTFAFGQQQYYGTRVKSLSLEGTADQSDLQLLPIRTSEVISVDNVRAGIQALFDTGRYSYIEVEGHAEDDGTRLVFRVRPHYFFSTFRLQPEKLLDRPVSNFFRLPYGEKFSRTVVDRIASEARDLLQTEGYFDATVDSDVQFDDTTRLARVVFTVHTRGRVRIGSVRITGGEEAFPRYQDLYDAFGLKSNDEFFADRLESGLRDIRAEFVNLKVGAFLNTRIEVKKDYRSDTHKVNLDLTIDPGLFTLVEVRGFEISQSKLKTLVPVFEEGSVDQDLIQEGLNRIRSYMQEQGYFEATARAESIQAPLDNAVQINYEVTPGDRHRINEIQIVGNRFFEADAVREKMKVREQGLFDPGVFSQELLDLDERTIEAMYTTAGFHGTKANGTHTERDHAIDVVMTISEGQQFPIEIITFTGNDKVSEAELREKTGLHEGQIYTPVLVDNARNALTTMYYYKGFPDIRVEQRSERILTNNGMQVTFNITEGEQYTIGKIIISGNTLTKDKIINRYSNLYANTPYNPEVILDSQQKLYATGLFSRVDIVPLEQSQTGIRNVLIQVEDASPILIAYGFGYQEDEKVRVTLEITHSNLFGLDRSSTIRLRGSVRQQLAQWTYREPRLFNRNLYGFGSVLYEDAERPNFTAARWDFSLQVGAAKPTMQKVFTSQQGFLVGASYQTVVPSDIRLNPRFETIKPEEAEEGETGIIQITRVGVGYVRDRRDDPISTTKGTFSTTNVSLASRHLGGEVNFASIYHQSTLFVPLGGAVLANSLRLGTIEPFGVSRKAPITERYFAGGSTTLRGFDLDQAGPPKGGNAVGIWNIEYRYPMPVLRIKDLGGAFFYDGGNAFPSISELSFSEVTHTAGAGLRYYTPLGPIRFDLGINLRPRTRNGIREGRFQFFFTLGQAF